MRLAGVGLKLSLGYTSVPMRARAHILSLSILLGLVLLVFPPSAHAYVDPGTGSYVLQIIVAGIAAASFSLKLFWGRIRAYFSKTPPVEQEQKQDE